MDLWELVLRGEVVDKRMFEVASMRDLFSKVLKKHRTDLTFLATVAAFPKGFLDEAMALQVAETAFDFLGHCGCLP